MQNQAAMSSPPDTRFNISRNSNDEDNGSVKFPNNNFDETLRTQAISPLLFPTDRKYDENESNNYEADDFELI